MREIVEIVKNLQDTPGRIEKNQILMAAFMGGHYTFFTGARYAYDTMITFGVKTIPLIEDEEEIEGTLTFDQFLDLAEKLRHRLLTGNAAKKAIREAAMKADADTWNFFYRRILLKDLKCGVEVSTINKVLDKLKAEGGNDYLIPTFQCQLAEQSEKHPAKMSGVKLIDTKMDGVRCLALLDPANKTCSLYTRSGNGIVNYPHVEQALIDHFSEKLTVPTVIDGELMEDTFRGIMEKLNRKGNVDTSTARFCVFDIIPYEHFQRGESPITQLVRHQTLMALQSCFDATRGVVTLTPKVMVDLDTDEGRARLIEYNQTVLDNGGEGTMVKDPNAPYQCKKTFNWLKVKPFIEVSLTVTGIIYGDENKQFSDVVGSLACEGNDDGKFYKAQVSSGITKAERELWTKKPDLVVGMIIEVQAMSSDFIEKDNYHSLRHPRLKGFRGVKKGEKI